MFDRISVTADDLLALPLEAALADSEVCECLAYSRVFRERVRQCEGIGDAAGAKAWWLLFRLTALAFLGTEKSGPVPLILAGVMVARRFRQNYAETLWKRFAA